ncbi:hypothetical protein Sjap_001359 [Stephania japonica]|uniref:Nodulin-like domain-containing protein n=1 Tax=Stephania japonica TaxID=461633 RepID=A0AAP0PTF4_9MAGN
MESWKDGNVAINLCFALQVVRGRYFMLFASFLIMAGAGASYLYSEVIKQTLGYDQTTLNLLGFFKDFGLTIGVLSGLISEVTPAWFVLLIGAEGLTTKATTQCTEYSVSLTGAFMNFGGYFMIWLAVSGKMPKPQVWQMCLYFTIGCNSQNFANTGVLVTCVEDLYVKPGPCYRAVKGLYWS